MEEHREQCLIDLIHNSHNNRTLSNFKQKINEQKLQAFDIGAMGKRPLSRREQEERRKREEETAAAHVRNEIYK